MIGFVGENRDAYRSTEAIIMQEVKKAVNFNKGVLKNGSE